MNWHTAIVLYEFVERWQELRGRWRKRGESGYIDGALYVLVIVVVVLLILMMLGRL